VLGRYTALAGYAVAVTLALGGCGGTHRSVASAGAGQPPNARFTGETLPGTVYVAAGPDDVSLDAYRLSGPLPQARRITYSPLGLGVQGLAADHRDVVLDRLCCHGLEFLEQLNLERRGGLPGSVLGSGTDPGLSSDGRLARVVTGYDGCRCDALVVRPSLLGPDRVVYRDPHPGTIITDAWGPGDRLAVIVGTTRRDGTFADPEILIDPGTTHRRTIKPGSSLELTSGVWFGPRGEFSYELTGRVVIQPPTGGSRSFLLTDFWHAFCWLPNGKIFTASYLDGALGMLDPGTGAITTVGHYASSSLLFVLDCPEGRSS
jgi:hypothetical protein